MKVMDDGAGRGARGGAMGSWGGSVGHTCGVMAYTTRHPSCIPTSSVSVTHVPVDPYMCVTSGSILYVHIYLACLLPRNPQFGVTEAMCSIDTCI